MITPATSRAGTLLQLQICIRRLTYVPSMSLQCMGCHSLTTHIRLSVTLPHTYSAVCNSGGGFVGRLDPFVIVDMSFCVSQNVGFIGVGISHWDTSRVSNFEQTLAVSRIAIVTTPAHTSEDTPAHIWCWLLSPPANCVTPRHKAPAAC